jgi:hypothetical protein
VAPYLISGNISEFRNIDSQKSSFATKSLLLTTSYVPKDVMLHQRTWLGVTKMIGFAISKNS